jgi:O-succinylbenzoic acid--CoA ligase
MLRSARLTCDFLGLRPGDTALLCLPLGYIAGKMMVVRALVGEMKMELVVPSSNPLLGFAENRLGEQTLLAVTPHQLGEIMRIPESLHIFKKISHVIIGGGAISEYVEMLASQLPESMKVYATYGMTETLSHIALRRINGVGRNEFFTPLEGVQVSQDAEGCLIVSDVATTTQSLYTNDLVELLFHGDFRILGRRDNVISSGGVKLQIEALEQQLSETISGNFLLTYVHDDRLGQALTMLYESEQTADELRKLCLDRVGRYEVPKHFFHVEQLPLTETGKPARGKAHDIAERLLQELL